MTSPGEDSGAIAASGGGSTEHQHPATHPQVVPPPDGMRTFIQVLVNTALANITTSFLWFALTFWVYLETRSVLATGIIGGAYMLLIALFAMLFGTIVDRHRKHRVMVLLEPRDARGLPDRGRALPRAARSRRCSTSAGRGSGSFSGIILFGGRVENMRNIALSTTVTLLVPVERHANANGLVGTVQGVAFIVTSVFSGLAIGLLGMGWTLVIAIALTLAGARAPAASCGSPRTSPRGDGERSRSSTSAAASGGQAGAGPVRAHHLLDASTTSSAASTWRSWTRTASTLFPVEWWGVVLGVTATGFIIGGARDREVRARAQPDPHDAARRRSSWACSARSSRSASGGGSTPSASGCTCAIIPVVEASEQTVIQKVVPFQTPGSRLRIRRRRSSRRRRPITAFLIAPIAQFWIIPYMKSDAGQQTWGWLLGDGEARGIALVFLFSGLLIMVVVALLAFTTRSRTGCCPRSTRGHPRRRRRRRSGRRRRDEPGVEAEVAAADAHADARAPDATAERHDGRAQAAG